MDKSNVAEWILTRSCGRKRASEIVGDLLEQATIEGKPSPVAFWISTVKVLFAMNWRSFAGIFAAIFTLMIPTPFFRYFVVHSHLRHDAYPSHWIQWAFVLHWIGVFFWSLATISFFRYGLRDRLTQLSGFLAATITATACFTWLPHAPQVIPIAAASLLALLLIRRDSRRATACGASVVLAMIGTYLVFGFVYRYTPGARFAFHFDGERFLLTWMTCLLVEGWALTRLRRRFLSAG